MPDRLGQEPDAEEDTRASRLGILTRRVTEVSWCGIVVSVFDAKLIVSAFCRGLQPEQLVNQDKSGCESSTCQRRNREI